MSLLAVRAQLITPLLEIFGAKSNNTRRHKKKFLEDSLLCMKFKF